MSILERGTAVFKPRARLLSLLGEQLITNEVIAVVELVKNAYDADATSVTLTLEKVSNIEEGKIIIEDDGTGMTLDTILNVWLEPGTDFRKAQRDKGEKSALYKRSFLGEKGIGRFAAHRLGNVINLTTRIKDSDVEVDVEVNWKMFDQSKHLDEVPVSWMTRKPKVFAGDKHGTRIVIIDLKSAWTQNMVEELKGKLDALQAPLKEKFYFEIRLVAQEFPKILETKKIALNEIFGTAPYSFEGVIDKNGCLSATYHFKQDAFPEKERSTEIKEDLRGERFLLPQGGVRSPLCGVFSVRFYAWDLDATTLKETVTRAYYDRAIKPNCGVRIHRDGFRVWPFGEPGNDWLNLDSRRLNNMTKCVSNNQIVGIVNISHDENPKLVDKTDREGIIENDPLSDFKDLVLAALNLFEIERRKDRIEIASLRDRKIRMDRTTEAIEKLREKMKKKEHIAVYEEEVKGIENAYLAEVRDTIDPLIVSAGIGIAYLMPAHEITLSIQNLEKILKSLQADLSRIGVRGEIADTIPNMLKVTDMIRDIADGALELTRRKGESFSLHSALDFSCYIKMPTLKAEKIQLNVIEKDKITIKGQKNLVMACLLNLLDNATYWLSNVKEKSIQILIDHDVNSHPRFVVSDNGPGIRKEDLPYLGEAFWTRKTNGTGLGLFICKRAMKANDGEVDFGFFGEDASFLSGANVILRFSPEVEVKG